MWTVWLVGLGVDGLCFHNGGEGAFGQHCRNCQSYASSLIARGIPAIVARYRAEVELTWLNFALKCPLKGRYQVHLERINIGEEIRVHCSSVD